MKQILLNLLSNALKFTHQGSVTISVRRLPAERSVQLSVSDTGIGIAPADQERIFEDFRQLDNSPTRAYGGTGLGLSICRRLAQMLGGRIWVESRRRPRLHFSPRLANPGTPMTNVKSDRPRVLLVDDYRDAREMYSEYLEFSGFDVVEAANGMEALQRAVESAPDIVLMDLSLPVMDGWEATRRLKQDERTAQIPVVALTGHALAGVSEDAKQAGCDAFVTKPCLPEDLVKEIRRVLERYPAGTGHKPKGGTYAKTNA